MKRASFLFAAAFVIFASLGQTGTEAIVPSHADRFVGAAAEGAAGTYNFDRAHTVIGFRVKHNGLIDIPGFFRDFSGAVNYDPKEMTKSSVEFTAKATSIDTGNTGRDTHLRSKDFFEVDKFVDVAFKSTKVEQKGKQWMVTGDFTMKGVTKSITFPFNITGFLPASERSGGRMGITAETMIKRSDYGITYGQNIVGTSTPVIADEVHIHLAIEAPMPRAAAPAAAATPAVK